MEKKEICVFKGSRIRAESKGYKGIKEMIVDRLSPGNILHGYFDGVSSQDNIIKIEQMIRGVESPYGMLETLKQTRDNGDYIILTLSYEPRS